MKRVRSESELDKKRRELAEIENSMQAEHQKVAFTHAIKAIENSALASKIADIDVNDVSSFMNSRLQGGPCHTALFKITLNDGSAIIGNANRGSSNRDEPLVLVVDGKKHAIETPFSFGNEHSNIRKFYEKQCDLMGIAEETPFSEAILKMSEFWAHLTTVLVVYSVHMKDCPKESYRPMHLGEFGRLFIRTYRIE